ncbi:hypothetical protein RFI_10914 [Reticulomyxa filosa]|uniref:Kinesin motor domain-containing protein n=1 Tax=Reticulomyxa filosa TaxID=46433 RepID=X6NLG4_RETFI|nr:hypothetical protein RFI_10914 [Reticulomyxa filosa]|eukprot:ETO26222.1 hypothetical protein RFI_10914 [Reticulomyxa filosa]
MRNCKQLCFAPREKKKFVFILAKKCFNLFNKMKIETKKKKRESKVSLESSLYTCNGKESFFPLHFIMLFLKISARRNAWAQKKRKSVLATIFLAMGDFEIMHEDSSMMFPDDSLCNFDENNEENECELVMENLETPLSHNNRIFCRQLYAAPLSDNDISSQQANHDFEKSRIQVVVKKTANKFKRARKTKVDLTKYTQNHDYVFDAAYDEHSTNIEIYNKSVKPLLKTIFYERGGKATCFAYGQTGSGKTYTLLGNESDKVQGIYVLAVKDIYDIINSEMFHHLRVIVSFYEIYGGKLFDLLANRAAVVCREDGKKKLTLWD